MSRSEPAPRATLRVTRQRGDVLVCVDCPRATTTLALLNGAALGLSEAQLVTVAAFRHQDGCGVCDLEPVFARGDRDIQERTERAWAALVLAERRN